MTTNAEKSAAGNVHIENQNLPSTNTGDQIFLKALQELIVCVVDPERMNAMDQIPLGPEAGKLITALRDFVSCMVGRAESMTQNTIVEVSLDEDNNVLQSDNETSSENIEDGKEASLITISSAKLHVDKTVNNDSERLEPSEHPESTFQEKLLKGLREHVFNAMPIRMLSFETHGSILQIILVEREAIHTRLESALRAKIHQVDHVPIIRYYDETDEIRLETDGEAIERLVAQYARYAILSHTWLRTSSEITYGDWNKGLFNAVDPGYQKLVKFCTVAWKDYGLTLGWMDTICINKESSSELDESIRSMYNWYSRAYICITYLAETTTLSTMHQDRWFTRGWTLQELLAPRFIKFYDSDWKRLIDNPDNDKHNAEITAQIKRATTISEDELDSLRFAGASITRKMQLAAKREVTRKEDIAYSLMGIFDVSMSTAYGEGGERAFFRLLQQILTSDARVLDILNWAGDVPYPRPHASHILPSSPLHYLKSYQPTRFHYYGPVEPLILTHIGLRVPVILMPAITTPSKAPSYVPIGDFSAAVEISPVDSENSWNAPDTAYNLLDARISGQDGLKEHGDYQLTLAVFTFFGEGANIFIIKRCIAKVLNVYEDMAKVTSSSRIRVIHTNAPVVFDLINATNDDPTQVIRGGQSG